MTDIAAGPRSHPRVAWGLFGLAVSLVATSLVVMFLHLEVSAPVWGVRGAGALWAVAFGIVGAVLAARLPRNPIGWLYLATAVMGGAMNLTSELALAPTASGRPEDPTWLAVTSWAWIPLAACFAVAMVLFPDGRPASRWWGRFLWWFACVTVIFTVAMAAWPESRTAAWFDSAVLGAVGGLWQASALVAMSSILWRRRTATPVERLQLRWVVSAAVLVIVAIAAVELGGTTGLVPQSVYFAATAGVSLVIPLLPVSIGVAILRYRLYAIDRILSRTAVYGVVTATLVALYLGTVLVLQVFFTTRSGQLPNIVVAITTLLVAAAFHPVRLRAQRLVDRRFNRRLSDAARVIEAFGQTLRDEVDLDAVARRLRQAVRDTVQPADASVWMRRA